MSTPCKWGLPARCIAVSLLITWFTFCNLMCIVRGNHCHRRCRMQRLLHDVQSEWMELIDVCCFAVPQNISTTDENSLMGFPVLYMLFIYANTWSKVLLLTLVNSFRSSEVHCSVLISIHDKLKFSTSFLFIIHYLVSLVHCRTIDLYCRPPLLVLGQR